MIPRRIYKYFGVLLLYLVSCAPTSTTVVRIAAASNLQFALDSLTAAFEKEYEIKTELITASSGKLTAQIKELAPFDVFLSADMKYPKAIAEAGLSSTDPKIYAYGQLVLWSAEKLNSLNLSGITHPKVRNIALPNPTTTPYGRAAMSCLNNYKMFPSIKEKLVYGENISQVNQFITTGAADVGFTAKSVVMAPKLKRIGTWIDLDPQAYEPIQQGVVLIRNNRNNEHQARQFYNYLFSDQAQQILKDFGYLGIDKK